MYGSVCNIPFSGYGQSGWNLPMVFFVVFSHGIIPCFYLASWLIYEIRVLSFPPVWFMTSNLGQQKSSTGVVSKRGPYCGAPFKTMTTPHSLATYGLPTFNLLTGPCSSALSYLTIAPRDVQILLTNGKCKTNRKPVNMVNLRALKPNRQ